MNNPIKPSVKTEIIPVLLLIIIAVASIYFYNHFPDKVPTHWNFAGQADGHSSRAVGAFALPGMLIGFYLMFLTLPLLDPKKERYQQFKKVYHVIKGLIIIFMATIYTAASLTVLGYNVPINKIVPFLVGGLFILLGNYFGKIKPNWFLGIRTPWTLSSEEVWNQTHRLGGKAFVLGGVSIMFIPLFPAFLFPWLLLGVVFSISLGPIVYSYILYKREEKNKVSKEI